ncbi:MAG: DNA circularization N-terminal domain-containing protein [Oxalobacter formigenes]|nr:DNA circularization N-terminal domain-containing protein [Oxalobacter formigenes]
MSWRKNLLPASFRGVPFYVESATASGGRRMIIREYPQRDKASAEDNGMRARQFSVTGFLIGQNFIAGQKRLIAALEEKGSGTLVHPFYGEKTVVLSGDFSISVSANSGGMCTVTMPFTEADTPAYPSASADLGAFVLSSAGSLSEAAQERFAGLFSLEGMPDFVRESAISKVGNVVDQITAALSGTASGIDLAAGELMGAVRTLVDTPGGLGNAIGGLIGSVQNILDIPGRASSMMQDMLRSVGIGQPAKSGSQTAGAADTAMKLVMLANGSGSAANPDKPLFNTPARVQEAANSNAIDELVRNEALANAGLAAAVVPPTIYDEMTNARDAITAALDREALYAPVDVANVLTQLRLDVYRDMTNRASKAARIREITLPQVLPALVVAYDLYEDAARAAEIVERNAILNPAFLPAKPLRVLTQ